MNHNLKNAIKKVLFKNNMGVKFYSEISSMVRKNRRNLSDKEYVITAFKENNGTVLDLDTPRTFNEKLLWLSLYDRDPLKSICADKFVVRQYVKQNGYEDILNELYGVYNSVDEINYSKLPQLFFMKTNHDSGTYALVHQSKPKTIKKATEHIGHAMQRNYYYDSREWQYMDIKPLVLCEKYIEVDEPYGLVDYRFYCFNGQIGFVAVDIGTTSPSGKHSFIANRNLYDRDFNLLDAKLKREHFNHSLISKPENYDRMLQIAEKLSAPFKHVRVDLYNVHGKIIFGEMTFCNGGGMQVLEPLSFNLEIGKLIDTSVPYVSSKEKLFV